MDGIAALVGGATPGPSVDVILRSDAELRARIHLAGQRPTDPITIAPLPPALVRAALDEIVGELLIAREAARVRVRAPTPSDLARERQRLADECGGAPRLAEVLRVVGARAAEVDVVAQRRALVGAFLVANLEGTAQITDAEVERAYAEPDHPFVGQPLADVREELRAWLARRALQTAVARWVALLRARTTVRVLP